MSVEVDSLMKLGSALLRKGDFDGAMRQFRQLLQMQPDNGAAHYNIGLALHHQGLFAEACTAYQQALQCEPGLIVAVNNLGVALKALGKFDQAIECYRQILQFKPDHLEAHANLANALALRGHIDEAAKSYRFVLSAKPDCPQAHFNFGFALSTNGRVEEASAEFRETLHLNPHHADASYQLGIVEQEQGRVDVAAAHYRKALAIRPDFPDAHNSLGAALVRQAKWHEALEHYQEALRLRPHYPEASWNLALLWLTLGNFEQGWPAYEWRWTQPGYTAKQFPQPVWDGSDLTGRTILLHAEQGLGDTLQMIRYAPIVKSRGATVIVQCQPALFRLLRSVPGIDHLVAEGSPLSDFDVHAPLFSLPALFHTSVANVPNDIPYLRADAVLVEKWQQELRPSLQDRPNFLVGICWQGSPTYGYDSLRSIPLEEFARLAELGGVRLISLQKEDSALWRAGSVSDRSRSASDRRKTVSDRNKTAINLLDFGERLDGAAGPFMDTAAIMMNLDLVISSDTSLAHLAGALGVPVWLAVPQVPDWRWLLNREDSPWYLTMRLFRQASEGDWSDVFRRMATKLKRAISEKAEH